MEKGLGWLAVILFLVLMVAGEGAWTTKEEAWGSNAWLAHRAPSCQL